MRFRLRPRARRDISEILAYLAARNPTAARAWREAIFRIFDLLDTNPQMGTAHDDVRRGLRMFPTGRYIVLYRLDDESIVVLRVIHAARDWRIVPK
ncbi:type II toxin-antitoxin system RelE/ParE family toxin [Neorhizobium huautlense]|uniref:type II toxin-antitoxin system RelE/ParE family toxin n=1 Tax=Neorhizobium huautlense TaxID=67774 RepID=UPI003593FB62